jgi:GNAT superfamily N-acetyltransferase
MPLEIRTVDFGDAALRQQCLRLEQQVFRDSDMTEQLMQHIVGDSHPETLLLGSFDGDRVAGLNGFIAHPVCRDGEVNLAFQSCLSATDPDYRGQGIFTSLIEEAKRLLKQRGAAFLFGYPNANSGPIFTGRLGFRQQDLCVIYLPLVWPAFWARRCIDIDTMCGLAAESERQIMFDAYQTAEWKRKRRGDALMSFEYMTNFLFGHVVVRRVRGVAVRMFAVGGYEINKPPLLPQLVREIRRKTGAHAMRFVLPTGGSLARAARYPRSGAGTEPLITFPLDWDPHGYRIEAWTGLKDVY